MSDTIRMDMNDVWFIPVQGTKSDITGSRVTADKPVACFTGNTYANIPEGQGKGGYIIEQDSPWYLWGRKYYITPIKGANNNSILRLFAADTATTIYRNGWEDQVAALSKPYRVENEGWVEVRAAEGEPQAVTLLSEMRFNVVQYNAASDVNSRQFQMSVIPFDGMLSNGYFAVTTPKNQKDPNRKDYINIVYPATKTDSIPRNLMVGELNANNEIIWTTLGERFGEELGYEFIDPTNPKPDRKFYCKQIELPANASFQIKGKDKYAVYQYGYSDKGGYGFPLSYLNYEFELPDTVSPIVVYTMDCHGNVPDPATGQPAFVKDLPEDSEDRSNIALIYFDKNYSYNYTLQYDTFVPGEDSIVNFKLTPIDPKFDARAIITVTDRAGNDTTVIIEYKAPRLTFDPLIKNYGMSKTGEMTTYAFTLRNTSLDSSYFIKNIRLKKGDEGFTLNHAFNMGFTLGPGDTREFTITYNAKDELFHDDSIGVEDDCALLYKGYVYAGPINSTDDTIDSDIIKSKVLPNPVDSRGGLLEFENPVDGTVEIILFNSLKQVAVLQSGWMKAGMQSIRIPVEALPSGAYTYRVVAGIKSAAGNFVITK